MLFFCTFFEISSSKLRQIGRHFADDTFKSNFLYEGSGILIHISVKSIFKCAVNQKPAFRADSRLAPSQRETALLCNDVSHWLGVSLESALRTDSDKGPATNRRQPICWLNDGIVYWLMSASTRPRWVNRWMFYHVSMFFWYSMILFLKTIIQYFVNWK